MLIDIFTDYIRNQKDLREYVEKRKGINERGEFNDAQLLKIQENLEKLKNENPEIHTKMYAVLEEVFKRDAGDYIDYPLNFARVILNMEKSKSLDDMYNKYKAELNHQYQTVN
jgi:predicted nuclease with TOPRIM domain